MKELVAEAIEERAAQPENSLQKLESLPLSGRGILQPIGEQRAKGLIDFSLHHDNGEVIADPTEHEKIVLRRTGPPGKVDAVFWDRGEG